MSTQIIPTKRIGEKLREVREQNQLPLRQVAAMLDIDVAILSKMERGERKISKDTILKLANIYEIDSSPLLVLFLSEKIFYELRDEELGMKALKVAEQRIKYFKNSNKK